MQKTVAGFDIGEFEALEDDDQERHYYPTKTLDLFHADNSFVRAVMGPVGSGKSVGMVGEIMKRIQEQRAWKGVRRSRWGVIRNTYGQLSTTTINTFKDWVPSSMCRLKETPPICAYIDAPLADGTKVEAEILFVAVDRPDQVNKLLSLDLTGVWLNEVREIPKIVLNQSKKRVGRYPGTALGGPSWNGVIMDSNPCDDDHWYYELAEVEKPEGWTFFRQPGGLIRDEDGAYHDNPDAENVENLPPNNDSEYEGPLSYEYYHRQIPGEEQPSIDAYVLGLYASVYDGKPVYKNFWNDTWHLSKEPLPILNGLPLRIAFDFGLTPACVIGQVTPVGGLNILRELYCEDGGIRQFVTDQVRPMLLNEFPMIPPSQWIVTGDPRGDVRAQANSQAPDCFRELALAGMPGRKAPTNKFETRRQAVMNMLRRSVGSGNSAFKLDPSCKMLRKGFNGGYQFRRIQVSASLGERHKDEPEKNRYSHPHDALQYLCLDIERPADLMPPDGRHRNMPRQHNSWAAMG